ncbi:type II secretion system protein [bacterium]|nr:type II secretion system protein [bacterium]
MKKSGFTLAEVLITLGVIGVVAAISLPILIKKYDEMVTVNRVKQTYSILSQAYLRAVQDNDDPKFWDIGTENSQAGADKLYNYFKPYLYKVKDCNKIKRGCFADNYKALFTEQPYIYQPDGNSTYAGGVLKNGTVIAFWSIGSGCKYSDGYQAYVCGSIKVDINGKKGPNRAGHDFFNFDIVYYKGIKASYVPKNQRSSKYGEYCQYNDPSQYNGIMCTGWIIKNGNMDYLRHDVSNKN